jgi:hypothetical protein
MSLTDTHCTCSSCTPAIWPPQVAGQRKVRSRGTSGGAQTQWADMTAHLPDALPGRDVGACQVRLIRMRKKSDPDELQAVLDAAKAVAAAGSGAPDAADGAAA